MCGIRIGNYCSANKKLFDKEGSKKFAELIFMEYHFYFSPVIVGIMIKIHIICYPSLIPIFEVRFKYGIGFAFYSNDMVADIVTSFFKITEVTFHHWFIIESF